VFCPSCGKASFEEDDNQKYLCKKCNFTFYRNVASAVAVVIRCKDEVLFTIRATDPGKDMLDLPGGFVNPKESLEEAARREILEELRIDVGTLRYLFSEPNIYSYKDVNYNTIDAVFEVQFDEKPMVGIGDDVAGFVWRTLNDLKIDDIALSSIRKGVEKLRTA
jgi:ADP-ribose pyrophosphatase YjhB (NUDIX family)